MVGGGTTRGEDAGPYDDDERVVPAAAGPVHVPLPPAVVESALVVGPGDTLVIRCRPDTSSAELDHVQEAIEETPLRGRVLVVAAEQIGVVR
jgi:hypothetical protein